MKSSFLQRLTRHLSRLFRQPIRVFVFHQVSDMFEPETMWECDWTQTEVFKRKISTLMKKYRFISIEAVKEHLAGDKLRFRHYAALTADDGWASLTGIMPWLVNQRIPVTLFLNPSCLDGVQKNSRESDKLLTKQDVLQIVEAGKPFVTVASHGWTHKRCDLMTMDEFKESVRTAEEVLSELPAKVPFFAFPSGRFTPAQVTYLRDRKLVPVFVDGEDNVRDPAAIHRFCIDEGKTHG